jgi:hypothetical protein
MCQSLVKIVNQIISNALNNVDEIPTIVQVSFFKTFVNKAETMDADSKASHTFGA